MRALSIIRAAGAETCHPWPRHILRTPDWAAMAQALPEDPALCLVALWADTVQVHALLHVVGAERIVLASVSVEAGGYPALSPARPGAAWFERTIHDLYGHRAEGGIDSRPWLDHGTWPHAAPLSARPPPLEHPAEPPSFLPAVDEGVASLPIGPVTGTLDDAFHLRLGLHGEAIAQAEARLGYLHRGIPALLRGKAPRTAARFVARLAADATVAHALAFAQAAEAAMAVTVPPRAVALRRMMLECERIAVHLDDLAMIGAAVGASGVAAACAEPREHLLRGLEQAFGHRLMMDCVVPGGLAATVGPAELQALRRGIGAVAAALPGLRRRLEASACLPRLTGLGTVPPALAETLALGGVAGRASGRRWDARLLRGLDGFVPALERAGDAAARTRLRVMEIVGSLDLLAQLLDFVPEGEMSVALPMVSGEGVACVEAARGDVWHWLRLDHGQIAAAFPRDPGWALWPATEAALHGAAAEETLAILRSFGLVAAGVDL